MFKAKLAALLAALVFLFASTALAGQHKKACAERLDAITHLSTKYGEIPVHMGLANNGGVLEVLSNQSGSSWTILVTMPNGVSCMLATGESWENIARTFVIPRIEPESDKLNMAPEANPPSGIVIDPRRGNIL